jgi:hypothetical protein
MGWETKNMVSKPENIFWLTRKMLYAIGKIFSIIQNIVRVMYTILKTIWTMAETGRQ